METETNEKVKYNEIPKQVSRKDFNKYINPHLRKRNKGPKPKLSYYKILAHVGLKVKDGIIRLLRKSDVTLLRLCAHSNMAT